MAKKTEMIGFKTTTEIKAALTAMAQKEDRSLSYIINRILQEYFSDSGEMDSPSSQS